MSRIMIRNYLYRPDLKILFSPKTGITYALDEAAIEICEELSSGVTMTEAANKIAARYTVESGMVEDDINEFFDGLESPDDISAVNEEEKDLSFSLDFPCGLEVALTKACQLDCSFCHDKVLHSNGLRGVHFPFDRLEILMREAAAEGLMRIRYSGGEPMLYPYFKKTLELGAELSLYQVLFTNGVEATREEVSFWKNTNVREVLISLHGQEELHDALTGVSGSFSKALAAIRLCQEEGIVPIVEMTLTRNNVSDLRQFIRFVKSLNIKEFRIMRYVSREKDDEMHSLNPGSIKMIIAELQDSGLGDGMSIRFPCSQRYCLSDESTPILIQPEVDAQQKYLVQNCFAGITWVSLSHNVQLRICPHSSKSIFDLSQPETTLKDAWKSVLEPLVRGIVQQKSLVCSGCLAWNKCLGGCYLK